MKISKITTRIILLILIATSVGISQDRKYAKLIEDSRVKRFYNIEVAYFKTTHIIFPVKIKYADVGTENVAMEQASEVDNVLKVKANEIGFPETNLSVITEDGSFYSFVVNYNEKPAKMSFDCVSEDIKYDNHTLLTSQNQVKETKGKKGKKDQVTRNGNAVLNRDNIILSNTKWGVNELNKLAEVMIPFENHYLHMGDKSGKVNFYLNGLYAKENYIFMVIEVDNKSNLPYQVDFIKTYIRDQEQRKRELYQEYEIPIVYRYWDRGQEFFLDPRQKKVYVLMVDTFQMQEGKRLEIDINEKKGGRNANMYIDFRGFEELLKRI